MSPRFNASAPRLPQIGWDSILILMTIAVAAAVFATVYALVLQTKLKHLESQLCCPNRDNDERPIITMQDTQGFHFDTASAELSDDFRERLRSEIAPQVEALAKRHRATVIEVVGHTDEVPLGPTMRVASNLDRTLQVALTGGAPPAALIPADNVGLGMARAAAVAMELSGLLGGTYTILPLSAGATTTTAETLAQPVSGLPAQNAVRRRIEIRLRREFGPTASADNDDENASMANSSTVVSEGLFFSPRYVDPKASQAAPHPTAGSNE